MKGKPMLMRRMTVALLLALCACHGKSYYFTGRVFDGVSRAPVTSYKIQLAYKNSVVNGTVNKDGSYLLGPMPALADFTVTISAAGYRAFYSDNQAEEIQDPNCSGVDDCATEDTTQQFNAYVFPTNLQSPAATISFFLADSTSAPSGTVRLVPDASANDDISSLENGNSGSNAQSASSATANNVWHNSADDQLGALMTTFTNGQVQIAAGALVYGASYAVDVFGVAGYQITGSNDYTPGVDGNVAVELFPLQSSNVSALQVVYENNESPTPIGSATLVMTFNQPIGLSPEVDQTAYVEALCANFSLTAVDNTGTDIPNPAAAHVPGQNEYGISINAAGTVLTITATLPSATAFSAAYNAATSPQVVTATFGGLNDIFVVPKDGPATEHPALTQLTNASTGNSVGQGNAETVIVSAKKN